MTGQLAPHQTVGSVAEITTAHAGRYLTQLCKHFQHRCPVTFDQTAGEIAFAMGICRLQADAGRLVLRTEAGDAEALGQLEDVVARHLLLFAFREEMKIDWRRS